MCVHQGTNFLSKSFVYHFAHGHVSRGSWRWCHGLVVVVVIKLPCCHVHAWMAPDQSSNAAQSSSARPPMVLTCRRHACHVSHVDGGCHVVVMWIGATVCVVLIDRGGNWVRWCVVLIVKRRRGSSLAPHHMVVTCRCHACARHGSSAVMLPCPCVSWGRHVWGFPVPSRNHGGMLSCRRVDGGGRDTAHGDAK